MTVKDLLGGGTVMNMAQRRERERIREAIRSVRRNLVLLEHNLNKDRDIPAAVLAQTTEKLGELQEKAIEIKLWTDPAE